MNPLELCAQVGLALAHLGVLTPRNPKSHFQNNDAVRGGDVAGVTVLVGAKSLHAPSFAGTRWGGHPGAAPAELRASTDSLSAVAFP